jgi:hypothetical protein
MILPDLNLLIYAHNEASPHHDALRAWWGALYADDVPVGVPWAVSMGFVRLVTHPSVMTDPLPALDAVAIVEGWYAQSNVEVLEPGPRHVRILRQLFHATGVAGRLTTDTHLAAIAIEHQAELHSNDADFGRFPGLRWHNPVA